MEYSDNHILVRGTLPELPRYSHENHGASFLRLTLEVPRLSGTLDLLPVVVPATLLEGLCPEPDMGLQIEGQIRSHNQLREDGRHLQIFLFASDIRPDEGEPENDVYLRGTVCRQPVLRRTPLGREICDLMLAVPRAYHRADYLPCILWGSTAQEAARCHTRDSLELWGRLQSRNYTKLLDGVPETRTAYEVSAMTARIGAEPD